MDVDPDKFMKFYDDEVTSFVVQKYKKQHRTTARFTWLILGTLLWSNFIFGSIVLLRDSTSWQDHLILLLFISFFIWRIEKLWSRWIRGDE